MQRSRRRPGNKDGENSQAKPSYRHFCNKLTSFNVFHIVFPGTVKINSDHLCTDLNIRSRSRTFSLFMLSKEKKTQNKIPRKKIIHTSISIENKTDGLVVCICTAKLLCWAKNCHSLTFKGLKLYGCFYIRKFQ